MLHPWLNDADNAHQFLAGISDVCARSHMEPASLLEAVRHPKVDNMVRGGALADQAKHAIRALLGNEYTVDTSKINAQPGRKDIDITISSRRDPSQLVCVECKMSWRNTYRLNKRGLHQFQVKNHKSRSPMSDPIAKDLYRPGHCDFIISNPLNALMLDGSTGLKLGPRSATLLELASGDLIKFASQFWVFTTPEGILKPGAGLMVRRPTVEFDRNGKLLEPWQPLSALSGFLARLI